ncbi:PD-(D/E)XK nuclease family protein [Rhodococcus sp. IEGM1300]
MKSGRPQVVEPMELSMEDLYMFKQCPMRWKLSGVDGHVKDKTRKEEVAEQAKEVIQWYHLKRMDGELPSFDMVKRRLGEAFYGGRYGKKEILKSQRIEGERGNVVNMEQKLMKGILEMVARENREPTHIVSVTRRYRVKVSDTLYITGEIPVVRDRDGKIELLWIKTSFSESSEFYYRTDMGLTFLQLAWNSVQKRPAQSVFVFDAVSGKEREVYRTRADYQRLVEVAKMTEAMIRQNLIMPREQRGCNSCPKRTLCAQWKGWKK